MRNEVIKCSNDTMIEAIVCGLVEVTCDCLFRLTFDFFVKRLNEVCRINAVPNLEGKLIKS